jgi:8-oxo-dGTP diphosphatase
MDWTNWNPQLRAILCFILKENRLLLIRKLRGLGAGKISAPGGKIEPGETPLESAIRESSEEVGVVPHSPQARGILHFQFTDGLSIHCIVFLSHGCDGEPVATDEAIPVWTAPEAIPFHEMWADDALWLPLLLDGKQFRAYFVFDGEQMLHHRIEVPEEEAPLELCPCAVC